MRLSIFILALLLGGCTKYVYVPVSTCPQPPVIEEKVLMTDKLGEDALQEDILTAFVYDISYLKQLKNQYKAILDGYRKPAFIIK